MRDKKIQLVSVVMNNGIYYQLSKTFVTALDVGVGVRFMAGTSDNEYDNYPLYNPVFCSSKPTPGYSLLILLQRFLHSKALRYMGQV